MLTFLTIACRNCIIPRAIEFMKKHTEHTFSRMQSPLVLTLRLVILILANHSSVITVPVPLVGDVTTTLMLRLVAALLVSVIIRALTTGQL